MRNFDEYIIEHNSKSFFERKLLKMFCNKSPLFKADEYNDLPTVSVYYVPLSTY